VRVAFAPTFELFPQEAYYFLYAQHQALSYFDHPPVIAWCIAAAVALLGKSVLALRLCAFVLTLGTQLAFIALARRVLPSQERGGALVVLLTSGLFTVLSLIATPDVPLLLFWTLTLWAFHRAVFQKSPWAFLLGGLFAGLAFDGKYPGIFLQIGLVLFLLFAPSRRRLWRTPWPYLAIAIAQLVAAPVYLWNARHGFASFRFQTAHRLEAMSGPTGHWLLILLIAQLVLIGPPALVALVREIARAWRRLSADSEEHRERALFLLAFVLPLAVVCIAAGFFVQVKPLWVAPCYIAGVLLLAPRISRSLVVASVASSLVIHVAAAVEIFAYPVPIRSDDTFYGWTQLASDVQVLERTHPGAFVFSADGYKTSAELNFYLGEKVYGPNVLGLPGLQFDYLGDDLGALAGHDGLFLDSAPLDSTTSRAEGVPAELRRNFRRVTQLDPILVTSGLRIVRKFFVYHCQGYEGPRG
jgi:4-amino-4-deoxy-L-arabinose transferase-like glycosyltransferase